MSSQLVIFLIRATAPDGYVPKLELLSGPNDVNNWITSGNVTDAVRDGASFRRTGNGISSKWWV